jgi:hypothetical protein
MIFDADGGGLQDILVVSGRKNKKSNLFIHRLYLNTGKGL